MRSERYQIALIFLGIVATAFFGVFFYRELFPEYRIYQNDYIALEKFRSTYTNEPPPVFREGVKQIVFEREDKGPPLIDRCTSCHVALQLPHFSPTRIEYDINGSIVRDASGTPVKVANENYIWAKLDKKIADLTDARVIKQLQDEGENAKALNRLSQAKELESLKTAQVGDHIYDVFKVLAMHPLIGKETRPFEFHSIDEYGCTSCHSGNGKGLTTNKAHGPVFDEEYEIEYMGPRPEFLERDAENDPTFARIFNNKPGDALLFQTSPILVGNLIQAKCIQCHEQSATALRGIADSADQLASKKKKQTDLIKIGYHDEKEALISLLKLKALISQESLSQAIESLKSKQGDPALSALQQERLSAQLRFLAQAQSGKSELAQERALATINQQIISILGSAGLEKALEKSLAGTKTSPAITLDAFIQEQHTNPESTGSLFTKWEALNLEQSLLQHVEDTQTSFAKAAGDEQVVSSMASDVDLLTKNYHRGKQLYISQACYACHRIAGLSRGGVGPELTHAAGLYPWYMKEKIVWPQGTLKTSTMPNMHLDHAELEDLMTFLLGQKGPSKAVSETDYKISIQEWEAGRKMDWEKPIPPSQLYDLRYAMTVFATQGCAACHRLKGFESNVGYRIEKEVKEKPAFEALYKEKEWFKKLFPESIIGSDIVQTIDAHADEIDRHIVDNVREGSLLEELEEKYPDSIAALYSEFRFASRAKNHQYEEMANAAADPGQKKAVLAKLDDWKKRVHRILLMYVQEYGLGRLIGPRPNWSGIYRSDQWLMEHFHNPAGHIPNSIMPILPFDDTKFYALTYMLDVLGKRNRDEVRDIWKHRGFDPNTAFQIHCAQCHGDFLQGNGPVSQWIYPIPKNLRNAEFLRNLTKENAIQSIVHGVKGTPMSPWGEAPQDKYQYDGKPVLNEEEIGMLVDWLFSSIPGGTVIKKSQDVPKWQYLPQDVIDELRREGGKLQSEPEHPKSEADNKSGITDSLTPIALTSLPKGTGFYAALAPKVLISAKPNEGLAGNPIFDIVPNPVSGGDKNAYYIKKKYYTAENIEQGKRFFEVNCAVCHGKEADGAGIRASIMLDAKPRMLINLDWLKTRDDLRLLRSIKYGVIGTSMTPWGDSTSSLQRMQLVMYIRSLSRENEFRDQLTSSLYRAFERPIDQLDMARIKEYAQIEALQNEIEDINKKQQKAFDLSQNDPEAAKEALDLYKQHIELTAKLKQYEEIDQLLVDLKGILKKKGEIYRDIGMVLNRSGIVGPDWDLFLKMLALNEISFTFVDEKLSYRPDPITEQEVASLAAQIAANVEARITRLQSQKNSAQGKIFSEQRKVQLSDLDAQINMFTKSKRKLLSGLEEIRGLDVQTESLYLKYQEKISTLKN